jgi:hypothetical protein
VIGIAAAALKDSQNLNFAIPTTYLIQLIARMTVPVPLSDQTAHSTRSVLADTGRPSSEAIVATKPAWVGSGLEFRLQNKLDEPVRKIRLRFAFYDSEGEMISFIEQEFEAYKAELPAGYTVLRYCSDINNRIQQLTSRVEIQVLDFELVRAGMENEASEASARKAQDEKKVQELWGKIK